MENQGGTRRLGILGGTFDPVHNGHLALAEAARQGLGLELVLLVPASHPPHKLNYPLTAFAHRAAMLALAIRDRPGLALSRIEEHRSGPSYTIDTLRWLRPRLAPATELFFLTGMDAFAEIDTWKEYQRLPEYAHFVVADRPDHRLERLADVVARAFPDYGYDPSAGCWRASSRPGRIYHLAMEPLALSATRIRALAAAGRSLAGLVPTLVAEYIADHHLYRSENR